MRLISLSEQIYNYIKQTKNKYYSAYDLAEFFETTPEKVFPALGALRFDDVLIFNYADETDRDVFTVEDVSETYKNIYNDSEDKYHRQQTKKLIHIYRYQGYTPEQCSYISDIDIETVNKYWNSRYSEEKIEKYIK